MLTNKYFVIALLLLAVPVVLVNIRHFSQPTAPPLSASSYSVTPTARPEMGTTPKQANPQVVGTPSSSPATSSGSTTVPGNPSPTSTTPGYGASSTTPGYGAGSTTPGYGAGSTSLRPKEIRDFGQWIGQSTDMLQKVMQLPNPFQMKVRISSPKQSKESTSVKSNLRLSGIFYDKKTPMAIIDGELVYPGSKLADGITKISKIEATQVVIEQGDKRIILKLEE